MLSRMILYISTTVLNSILAYKLMDRYENSVIGKLVKSLSGGFAVSAFTLLVSAPMVIISHGFDEWWYCPAPIVLSISIIFGIPIIIKNYL